MEEDEFLRNKYPQKEREKMDASDFGDPEHLAFPIKTPEDVIHAAERLHDASGDQAAIKKRIIAIAKRKGFALPKTWEDEDGKGSEERMEGNETDTIERVDAQPSDISFYAPFIRVDDKSDKREVVGKATRGTPIDTYGTVITYDGSKKAFARAGRIPLREMHQPKAVGKGLEWWGDDTSEDIYLHSYISRGAEDTWTKVQEDVLVGYSIKGKNAKYGTIVRDGKQVAAIVDYDLIEVSLVDNPSCPGCDIAIMRGDGIEGVIASDEEMAELSQKEQPAPPATQEQPTDIERAGARLSNDTQAAMHKSIGHTLQAAKSQMQNCGCDTCQAVIAMLDPDNDGDIDLGGYDDPDNDGGMAPSSDDDMEERVERMVSSSVTSSMSAVYTRMQAMLGEFARRQTETTTLSSALERVHGALEQTANKADVDAKMDKVLTELESVKGLFERIAQTPLPGGPHTGRAATKHLSTDGAASPSAAETPDILRQINQAGVTLTPQQQALLVAGSLKPLS